MACVRRQDGFVRYAFAVSYHGGSSLGFTFQGSHENALLSDGTDLRGLFSIEGRIRRALTALLGESGNNTSSTITRNFENFQVSSRTDRGVHALKNTFHVDVRPRRSGDSSWAPLNLLRGINSHLVRLAKEDFIQYQKDQLRVLHSNLHITPHRSEYDVRLLSCRIANHLVRNNLYRQGCENQPEKIDWNARFTATSRTYCYRILHMTHPASDASTKIICPSASDELEYIFPFESGRSWIIRENTPLNMENMIQASKLLEGKQDFSSFRAKGCQRASPIVHINKIVITSQPVPYPFWYSTPSWMDSNSFSSPISRYNHDMSIITIMIQGESFLYRQVRNMVGCLVEVGQNKLSLEEIKDIIVAKDRRKAPPMAPAHGLYLVDVSHYWE